MENSEETYHQYEEEVNRYAQENPEPDDDLDDFEQMEDPGTDYFASIDELPTDDDVLKLTEYDGNLGLQPTNGVVAEYRDIDIEKVDKKHEIQAKNFVTRVTKFIIDFKDVELSDKHQLYIKDVAKFQLENLVDMMSLVSVNKEMLANIVRRVNSTQAEDYAMIGTYNNLVTLHLKLMKELQNSYKSLPSVLKKMRTEVLCNQELGDATGPEPGDEKEPITEQYGSLQFNNTKHLLKTLRAKNDEKTANAPQQ
jgi:cell division septation protein DedD